MTIPFFNETIKIILCSPFFKNINIYLISLSIAILKILSESNLKDICFFKTVQFLLNIFIPDLPT